MSYYDEVKTADALIEELRARIAELEAHAEHDEDNLEGLQHALVRANQQYTQAEATIERLKWMMTQVHILDRTEYSCPRCDRMWADLERRYGVASS